MRAATRARSRRDLAGARLVLQQLLDLVANRPDDRAPVLVHVGDHDHAVAEAFGLQPLAHDLQGRVLLAHEQQGPLAADGVGHEIDDGLALAGPRRPLHDQPAAAACAQDRGLLRRVARHGEVAVDLPGRRGCRLLLRLAGDAESGFERRIVEACVLQAPQVLQHRLAHERGVEEHRRAHQLS